MNIDIRIDREQEGFKFRVCGIVIVQDKVLLQKINNNDFYCFPGGHVEFRRKFKRYSNERNERRNTNVVCTSFVNLHQ